ncbi:hypothetical protein HYH02_003453 [Chlamydomonas schloesseri]|uniref:UDP-N-acetylglucosamine--dolichyl-phosphate N-acetylglucosaminephosphotransferase n=1 Tax=Chlamydomonas schloesseri TaxID=2026947 RepID=A0A836B9L6_9CHLO|nr:hypothetical protein HYH02_003453 [Chlamydomonas schloesseri]|eukprot:KAG2451673.1 hypothetical protein HYH02_003453 [Chlamydomonas schloesseri]
MSRAVQLAALGLVGFGLPAWAVTLISDVRAQQLIVACAIVSFLGFLGTVYLVPKVAAKTQARGICGKDLNKKGTPAGDIPIPESAGLAPGCVFLLCVICFELLHYYDIGSLVGFVRSGFTGELKTEPIAEAWLVDYNAALATIGFMLFLGFSDDVLDIRWRVKLILPLFASLPLLVAYSGGTGIALPKPLAALGLPAYLELGLLYKVYMVMLGIFCTNSINILAGVNGLEAGQTFIVACAVLLHNLLTVAGWPGWGAGGATPGDVRDGHLFSAGLMLPLAATTFGLLVFNWYPSKVFVGDTFTYFAGMTIAVAGILGHFSETLLLFLLPQVFNFVYSLPQLFGIVHCPRHRLPVFDPATGLLRPKDAPDWNLVNLTLQLFGRCGENALCIRLLALQVASCALTFGLRYLLQGYYK